MALVLCIGPNPEVVKARQLFLQQAGHRTAIAVNEKELAEACTEYDFDVVIIGQNLSPLMKQHVTDLIREHCGDAKILELYPTSIGRTIDDADAWMETPDDVPPGLADCVTELAKAS